ncbi:MAG: hypothetical protein ACK41W_02505 [Cyanobacteriota bacterium]|jgi:hypothetical protein
MLTPSTRLRLQAILERIGADQPVSLRERIYVQKFADRDQGVAAWLLRARRRQMGQAAGEAPRRDGIDHFLEQMNLGPVDPDATYRPGEDDIEGWFGGAPGWVRRS